MPKLSQYVEMAATQYLQEVGKHELDPHWIAEFYQDSGVLEDYPRQDLVEFFNMVQKTLIKKSERADKQARVQLDKIIRKPQKP